MPTIDSRDGFSLGVRRPETDDNKPCGSEYLEGVVCARRTTVVAWREERNGSASVEMGTSERADVQLSSMSVL